MARGVEEETNKSEEGEKRENILLKSKLNAKFFDFLDENRLIFVVLSGRFQNLL